VNDSHPWWLWPNLLALDAPAVAVTWQVFLASAAGVAVPVAASVVLGLVVWAAYLIDRSLDARRSTGGSERHRVAGRNSILWLVTAIAALITATVIAFTALPRAYTIAGLGVFAVAVVYFAAVHLVRAKNVLDRGLKEVSVGVVFAAGVAIPLLADAEPYANWLPGVVAFAALCWLNCALITLWENGPVAPPVWVAVVAGSIAIAVALDAPAPVALAVSASTAALVILHATRSRVSVRASRVLADVVLLSPILVAGFL
jgi:hypothetical protein